MRKTPTVFIKKIKNSEEVALAAKKYTLDTIFLQVQEGINIGCEKYVHFLSGFNVAKNMKMEIEIANEIYIL